MNSPVALSVLLFVLASSLQANEPPVARDNHLVVYEDVSRIVDVLVNDYDPEGEDLTLTIVEPPDNVVVSVLPDSTLALLPPPNFNGDDLFRYRITDPHGAFGEAFGAIFVVPIDDPPLANPDVFTVVVNTPTSLAVLSNDEDVDGDALLVSSLTDPGPSATVTVDPDQALLFEATLPGEVAFDYEIQDPAGNSASASVQVTIRGANNPPVAHPDIYDEAATNRPIQLLVLDNDEDQDQDPLIITAVTDPGSVAAVSIEPDRQTLLFEGLQVGTALFEYTVEDPTGATSSAGVEVTVLGTVGADVVFVQPFSRIAVEHPAWEVQDSFSALDLLPAEGTWSWGCVLPQELLDRRDQLRLELDDARFASVVRPLADDPRNRPRELLSETTTYALGLIDGLMPLGEWELNNVPVPTHWQTPVCVVDSGYQGDHPDLGSLTPLRSPLGFDSEADSCGHGTHVSGILQALTGNNIGVRGVSSNHSFAAISQVSAFDCREESPALWTYDSLLAVRACLMSDRYPRLLHLGFGAAELEDETNPAEEHFFDILSQLGVTTIAPAGNGHGALNFYPAAYSSTWSIGAVDETGAAPPWAATGDHLDFVAPGVGLLSTWTGSSYALGSGTSMSAAYVSGSLARLATHATVLSGAEHKCRTPLQFYDLVRSTALDLGPAGYDPQYGWGLVQVAPAAGRFPATVLFVDGFERGDASLWSKP